ncbi:MAG TPA: hypothetical protein VMT12_04220 [Syntrophales bacterium]|nr:hypothetical protein [Syntrophales bacterium]
MTIEERPELKEIEYLKHSLEEAEIIKTGMKLVLMNPSLNSDCKDEYEKAFLKLNDKIRELKIKMDCAQKTTLLSKNSKYES